MNFFFYGKQFLVDGDCETCWQSDKSLNGTQTINLLFEEPTQISEIKLQFQGGFAANEVTFVLKMKRMLMFCQHVKNCPRTLTHIAQMSVWSTLRS